MDPKLKAACLMFFCAAIDLIFAKHFSRVSLALARLINPQAVEQLAKLVRPALYRLFGFMFVIIGAVFLLA